MPSNGLRDLVVRRLIELGDGTKPLPYKEAALQSGGRVSHELIRQIALGRHSGRLGDEKIEGLAAALKVPVAQVYEVANIPQPRARWNWPARFDRLQEHERRIVESVAAGLLNAYERGQRGE